MYSTPHPGEVEYVLASDHEAEVERLRGLLREGHEGGYFDAPSGFYERVDAALKENANA